MTKKIADDIRQQYFARELKQAELAKKYGLTQGSISRIVSGHVWR
jgi:DNA-binding transcriptional regulator LsrR (DeoR family)